MVEISRHFQKDAKQTVEVVTIQKFSYVQEF